jgi:hypothetical protein
MRPLAYTLYRQHWQKEDCRFAGLLNGLRDRFRL